MNQLPAVEVDEFANPALENIEFITPGFFTRAGDPFLTGRTATRGEEQLSEVGFTWEVGMFFWKRARTEKRWLSKEDFRVIHPIVVTE